METIHSLGLHAAKKSCDAICFDPRGGVGGVLWCEVGVQADTADVRGDWKKKKKERMHTGIRYIYSIKL